MNSFFTIASLLIASSVVAIGEDCSSPQSLWDKATCAISTNTVKYQPACTPTRYLPANATDLASLPAGSVRGLVVMYHGFSGCPDAFNQISAHLADQGYVTMTPLLPGQGLNVGYNCDVKDTCTKDNFNPSEIPTRKDGYISWSNDVISMANEQISLLGAAKADGFAVTAMGLSVGGSLAPFAAELPNTPISKVIAINPLWSTTSPALDFGVKYCDGLADPKACITSAMGALTGGAAASNTSSPANIEKPGFFGNLVKSAQGVEHNIEMWALDQTIGRALTQGYDSFLLALWEIFATVGDSNILNSLSIFDSDYGWGAGCLVQRNNGRGGICSFKIKHLAGLQSFTEYAIGNLNRIPQGVAYHDIHSDIDGGARDSVSAAVVAQLNGSRCHFQLSCTLDQLKANAGSSNECGVPHSLFSHTENEILKPYDLYWEPSVFQTISDIVNDVTPNTTGEQIESTDSSKCVAITGTLNWSAQFNGIGPKYLANAQKKYGGK